jgi:peptidoglycan hydrolase CwlO-like protein
MLLYIYIGAAFLVGFILAWIIRTVSMAKVNKEYKSMQGLLESEKLIKETSHKENAFLLQSADASLLKTAEKLKAAENLIKVMDNDILLLQKSNEETEALLEKSEPAIHELKLKLIEANNTIARYKGQLGSK